jgi:hypothetical protein
MPSNRAPEFEGVLILFLALCSIAFVLRCYCRIAIVKSFGLDDYFAGISMVKNRPSSEGEFLSGS